MPPTRPKSGAVNEQKANILLVYRNYISYCSGKCPGNANGTDIAVNVHMQQRSNLPVKPET